MPRPGPEVQEEARIMGRYLRRRLLTAIPVFFGITILVFCMLNLAQGSILDLMGEGSGATDADRAALAASPLDSCFWVSVGGC